MYSHPQTDGVIRNWRINPDTGELEFFVERIFCVNGSRENTNEWEPTGIKVK